MTIRGVSDEEHAAFIKSQCELLNDLEENAKKLNHSALLNLVKEGRIILQEVDVLRGEFVAAEGDEKEQKRIAAEIQKSAIRPKRVPGTS